VRLGIHLPFKGPEGNVRDSAGVMSDARNIEAAGFDGVWIGDGLAAMARPDPLMWLLVAAAATRRVEVGTCIFQVPLRNPVELAQRLMTLHTLTNGRFTFGAGAGSGDRGYRAVAGDFDHRFKKLRDDLIKIRNLCNGEVVDGASLYPWPEALGGPPIVIGAWSSGRWMRRAAEEYDGWMCSGSFHRSKERGQETTFATLAEALRTFRDMGGRRAMISSVMVDLTQPESHLADDEPFNLRCGPESATERMARLAEIGYDDVLLVKTQQGRSLYEAHLSTVDLEELRSLVPRETKISAPRAV
jgi:alkanesulfonate monooxygenase SsuD/methylene tetrahydromethanopterin reductase-like flavin-dependent oxidoreductase (luciferase family)